MILLLKLILLTFIWVMGIKISTAEGMVFEKLGNWANKQVDKGYKIYEAIISCEWCLPSLHSVIGYAFAVGIGVIDHFEWKLVVLYPLVVCGTSLLSGLTWTIYLTINEIKENNKEQSKYFKNINNLPSFIVEDDSFKIDYGEQEQQ